MPNVFRNVPTPKMDWPIFPDRRTPEGRYELYRRRARFFVLRAFDAELAHRRGEPTPAMPIEAVPRDPFEPVRPIVIHETSGVSYSADWWRGHGPKLSNPAGIGVFRHRELTDPITGRPLPEQKEMPRAPIDWGAIYNEGVRGLRAAGLAQIERDAKTNAPWRDRSGELR